MRCPYGAIAIFIIFFKESEASDSSPRKWNWDKLKMKLARQSMSKEESARIDIVGSPKHTKVKDRPKQSRTPSMGLVTQHESQNSQVRPDESHAMNLLTQYRAQHPRSRQKSPQNSLRKEYLPVDSNPLYPPELGPAPPNQLLMNGEIISESQMYRMGLQRYGDYAPLHPKPPGFPNDSEAFGPYYGTTGGSTSGASGYPNTQLGSYFETEDERRDYGMSRQQHGNYAPLYHNPPYFGSDSEHHGSGYQH